MSRRTDKLKEKQKRDSEEKDPPICRRCLRTMTMYETDIGDFRWWCYYCESPMIGNPFTLFER